jgi:hypothetical protein
MALYEDRLLTRREDIELRGCLTYAYCNRSVFLILSEGVRCALTSWVKPNVVVIVSNKYLKSWAIVEHSFNARAARTA